MNTLLPLSELRGQYQEATHTHSLQVNWLENI